MQECPGTIPGQGTRSCMLQLRVCTQQLKTLHAASKIQLNQINTYNIFKNQRKKKAEHWRTDTFKLWCYRRESLDSKKIKPVNPKYSLEGLMMKPKLQSFGHLLQRADSLEKTLRLGKTEGGRRRGWDGWMASLTQCTWVWANSGRRWRTGKPGMLQSMGLQKVGHS